MRYVGCFTRPLVTHEVRMRSDRIKAKRNAKAQRVAELSLADRLKRLIPADELTEKLPELNYYVAETPANFTDAEQKRVVHGLLENLRTQLMNHFPTQNDENEERNDFYREIVDLLVTIASPACSPKEKLNLLQEWCRPVNEALSLSAKKKAFAKQFGFEQDKLVRALLYIIMNEIFCLAARQAQINQPSLKNLQEAVDALFKQISSQRPSSRLNFLLEKTIIMLLFLTGRDEKLKSTCLQDYARHTATFLPPLVQRFLVALLVAALIFIAIMGLQATTLGISPLAALSLANMTIMGMAQSWAVASVVVAGSLAILAASLPLYSPFVSKECAVVYQKARAFNRWTINPVLGLGPLKSKPDQEAVVDDDWSWSDNEEVSVSTPEVKVPNWS